MEKNENVTIVFNFDSSGTLKTQIQEGADVDIFISAGQKQMNQLDINADSAINTEGLDFVLADTRFNILENKVALAVPEGNPAGINSYDDMVAGLKDGSIMLAMGTATFRGSVHAKILACFERRGSGGFRQHHLRRQCQGGYRRSGGRCGLASSIRPMLFPRDSPLWIPPPQKCAARSSIQPRS